jgi:hypothetical protein
MYATVVKMLDHPTPEQLASQHAEIIENFNSYVKTNGNIFMNILNKFLRKEESHNFHGNKQ